MEEILFTLPYLGGVIALLVVPRLYARRFGRWKETLLQRPRINEDQFLAQVAFPESLHPLVCDIRRFIAESLDVPVDLLHPESVVMREFVFQSIIADRDEDTLLLALRKRYNIPKYISLDVTTEELIRIVLKSMGKL